MSKPWKRTTNQNAQKVWDRDSTAVCHFKRLRSFICTLAFSYRELVYPGKKAKAENAEFLGRTKAARNRKSTTFLAPPLLCIQKLHISRLLQLIRVFKCCYHYYLLSVLLLSRYNWYELFDGQGDQQDWLKWGMKMPTKANSDSSSLIKNLGSCSGLN